MKTKILLPMLIVGLLVFGAVGFARVNENINVYKTTTFNGISFSPSSVTAMQGDIMSLTIKNIGKKSVFMIAKNSDGRIVGWYNFMPKNSKIITLTKTTTFKASNSPFGSSAINYFTANFV